MPPFGSWFVDFDSFYEDPEIEGHVGDVEVWHPCDGRAGYYEDIPGGFLPPEAGEHGLEGIFAYAGSRILHNQAHPLTSRL